MNILSNNSTNCKESGGCGGKLIQKTGSLVKRKSRKYSNALP